MELLQELNDAGFELASQDLKSWVDISKEEKYLSILLKIESNRGNYGFILKLLNEKLSANAAEGVYDLSLFEERIGIFRSLGWSYLVDHESQLQLFRFPKTFSLF